MTRRRNILVRGALAAAATASLGLFAANGEQDEAPARPPAGKSAALRVDLLRRDAQQHSGQDVFGSHSWQPPAPPPARSQAEPPAPPPPVAPPLPFTFLGVFESPGSKQVFYLAEGDSMHAVSEGDILNELYRVAAASADELVLVYLPLDIKQSLALGGGK